MNEQQIIDAADQTTLNQQIITDFEDNNTDEQ